MVLVSRMEKQKEGLLLRCWKSQGIWSQISQLGTHWGVRGKGVLEGLQWVTFCCGGEYMREGVPVVSVELLFSSTGWGPCTHSNFKSLWNSLASLWNEWQLLTSGSLLFHPRPSVTQLWLWPGCLLKTHLTRMQLVWTIAEGSGVRTLSQIYLWLASSAPGGMTFCDPGV